MKPLNLTKVDLYFQYIIAIANITVTMAGFAENVYFVILLIMQLFINIYHFCTNYAHLQAKHRSVGFTKYREFYKNLTLVYVPTASLMTVILQQADNHLLTFPFLTVIWLIVPQFVLYAYIYLCKKEIDFIEQNELHILK